MNVSVIIPVYNASAFLERAVRSALGMEEVKEILLIEDHSTDNSLEICLKLQQQFNKIKLFQHSDSKNHGAGATRNLGLEKATQEFVAFLDADDYYLPNRFCAEKEIFKNLKIEGVFNAIGTEFISEKGKQEFREKFKNVDLTTVKNHAEGKDVFYGLLGLDSYFGTFFHLNGLTIRAKSIRKNNLKFNEYLRVHQDTDFIIKLSYCCYLKSGEIGNATAIRGIHDNNRITKIKLYSDEYNQRQSLLWKSVYNWFINKSIKKEYKNHIFLKKKSFELATKRGFSKYSDIFVTCLSNPKILKTRYRFTYLRK